MNWYNQIKQGISFNIPGSEDPLDRAKRIDDSGNIPDEAIDRLLDDMGYGETEESRDLWNNSSFPEADKIEDVNQMYEEYDLEYPKTQEEWNEPEDRPWDWEPPKPSVITPGEDPELEDVMRRMDEAVAATAVSKRVKQLVKTMPDFRPDLDHIYILMEQIASEIQRETPGLPKDPMAKMMIAERLESIIPPLFGKTMENLQQEGFSEGETGFIDIDL